MGPKQASKGTYSPNTNLSIGNVTGNLDLKVEIMGKSNMGTEFSAIVRVIEELSDLSAAVDDAIDEDFVKNPAEKLKKYTELTPYFENDYVRLFGLYSATYKVAWGASGVTEFQKLGIAIYLSYWSAKVLEKHGNNAVAAFHELVDESVEMVGSSGNVGDVSTFDANAVRFFLYQEFANCNIFSFKDGDE